MGVEVVRIGLQGDDGLNLDTVLAGCWHPALGQLVRSELFYDLLGQLIAQCAGISQNLTLCCHPSRVSDLVGHERKNILRLNAQGLIVDRIIPDEGLTRFECSVLQGMEKKKGSIITDLVGLYA